MKGKSKITCVLKWFIVGIIIAVCHDIAIWFSALSDLWADIVIVILITVLGFFIEWVSKNKNEELFDVSDKKEINDSIKKLNLSDRDVSFDNAVTLVGNYIPIVSLIKETNNHLAQKRIVSVLKSLNEKIDIKKLLMEIKYDENTFDLFSKLIEKCVDSGDKLKRAFNIRLFTDYYSNKDSRSNFSFSLMDSISALTEGEIKILAELTKKFDEYQEKNNTDVIQPSIKTVYDKLGEDPDKEINKNHDVLEYAFSRLAYAGFLIAPLGAVLSASVFSYSYNVTIIKRLITIIEQEQNH